jgi:hypothetical protein
MQTVYMSTTQSMTASREGRTFYNQDGEFLLRQEGGSARILLDDYLPDEGIFAEDSEEAEQCRHRTRIRVASKVNTEEFKQLMGAA